MEPQQLVAQPNETAHVSETGIQPVDQSQELGRVEAVPDLFQYGCIHLTIGRDTKRRGRDVDHRVSSVGAWLGVPTRSEPAACWKTESLIQGSGGRFSLRLNSPKRLTLLVR
ncbi:hypothetical protein D3C84_763170 [compost metagenome]